MAYKIKWSPQSSDDLVQIAEFISRDSMNYARIVVENILESTGMLSEFHYSGRIVPELGIKTIRELLIYSYRLIYQVREDTILIVAVLHGKRLLDIDDRI